MIERRVCYLTMCNSTYPRKLAFHYLEELKNEFERVYGDGIETAARHTLSSSLIIIQKTKKLYQDTRTQRNISVLNDEVSEVYQTMRNVLQVLVVSEKMDKLSERTSRLAQ